MGRSDGHGFKDFAFEEFEALMVGAQHARFRKPVEFLDRKKPSAASLPRLGCWRHDSHTHTEKL